MRFCHYRKYHEEVKAGTYNLFNNEIKTKTRRFIEEYNKLDAMENIPKEEIFDMASAAVIKEMGERKQAKEEKDTSLLKKFKEAKEEQIKKLDITKIMKEE